MWCSCVGRVLSGSIGSYWVFVAALGDQRAVGGWIRSMKGYSANRRHFVGLRSCGVLEDAGFGSFSYAACDECLRTLVSRIVFPGLVQPAWSCI